MFAVSPPVNRIVSMWASMLISAIGLINFLYMRPLARERPRASLISPEASSRRPSCSERLARSSRLSTSLSIAASRAAAFPCVTAIVTAMLPESSRTAPRVRPPRGGFGTDATGFD